MTRGSKLMRDAGPYRVKSLADGRFMVYPEWSCYPEGASWKADAAHEVWEGGGPGVVSRMSLATEMERFLNARRAGK